MSALISPVFFLLVGLLVGNSSCRPSPTGIGAFWHLTEVHLDFHYWQSANDPMQVCPSSTGLKPSDPGTWGDYRCDSPITLVNSSISAMKTIEGDPDFILWTGDNTLHTDNENKYLDQDLVIQTIKNVTLLLREHFPNTTVYAALGNHDYHPKDQMPPWPNVIVREVADQWRQWMTEEQYLFFRDRGFYSAQATNNPNTLIVILNTNLWDDYNINIDCHNDSMQQLAWLETQLQLARRESLKVFVIGHIPPGFFELQENEPYLCTMHNAMYIQLVKQYKDVVVGQFFGHHHTDSFRLFYDEGDQPDYSQFYLDLAMANSLEFDDWKLLYSAKDTYQINDVSPTSMHDVALRLKKPNTQCDSRVNVCEGNRLLQRYSQLNTALYNLHMCDWLCQRNHVCAIMHVGIAEHNECITTWSGKETMLPSVPLMLVTLLLKLL